MSDRLAKRSLKYVTVPPVLPKSLNFSRLLCSSALQRLSILLVGILLITCLLPSALFSSMISLISLGHTSLATPYWGTYLIYMVISCSTQPTLVATLIKHTRTRQHSPAHLHLHLELYSSAPNHHSWAPFCSNQTSSRRSSSHNSPCPRCRISPLAFTHEILYSMVITSL